MPSWIKFVFKVGQWAYAFYDEYRTEKRVNDEILAKARQEESKRYQDASNNAGPSTKKTLH